MIPQGFKARQCIHCHWGSRKEPRDGNYDTAILTHRLGYMLHTDCADSWWNSMPQVIDQDVMARLLNK